MVYCIVFFPSLMIVSLWFAPMKRLLECKIFQFLGSISVGIYLFHYPVQCMLRIVDIYCKELKCDFSSPVMWGVYVVLTIIISYVYQNFCSKRCEKCIVRYIKWLVNKDSLRKCE